MRLVDRYRFISGCTFDVSSGELRRDNTNVRLEPQPATVLALLASRAGEVVTHDEIRRAIWGEETHVDFQDGVHYCVRQIRAALGDQAQNPRFIDTIPRRGYRLRADTLTPVTFPDAELSLPGPFSAVPARFSWRRSLALACLGIALAATTAFVERRPNNHHHIAIAVLKSVHDIIF